MGARGSSQNLGPTFRFSRQWALQAPPQEFLGTLAVSLKIHSTSSNVSRSSNVTDIKEAPNAGANRSFLQ